MTQPGRMVPIRVAVVDDDPMVRSSLRVILGGAPDIQVVALLSDGSEAVPANLHDVDVVLMDIVMAETDGLAATAKITASKDRAQVIVLTTFGTDAHVLEAIRNGAAGFLLKDSEPEAIVDAIRRVAAGERILSAEVLDRVMRKVRSESSAQQAAQARLECLSQREIEIAQAIGEGQSNGQIADQMFISLATVKTHVGQIFSKLGTTNRVQIAILVQQAANLSTLQGREQ